MALYRAKDKMISGGITILQNQVFYCFSHCDVDFYWELPIPDNESENKNYDLSNYWEKVG